jgi:signal recognition particle subunit SRP54
LNQLNQVKKMGSLGGIMKLLPGVNKEMRQAAANVDDSQITRVEAIIHSMTPAERANPVIIDGSRRTRIAKGSGSSVSAVNQLLKQFDQMKKMMKQMGQGSMPQLPGGLNKMAQRMAAAQASRGEALPEGFDALARGMASAPRGAIGGPKGKKKKGGRVTPPKGR